MRRKINSGLKNVLIIYGGILLVLIITCITVYIVYNNKIKESAKQSLLAIEKITELVPNNSIIEEASSQISKTIDEAIQETTNQIKENEIQEETVIIEDAEPTVQNSETITTVEEITIQPLEFAYPIEGEIVKEFAIENLIYSETLQEWTVHKGIDIKAPRTTVVKSAEEGTVQAIKNDPRYGLTVIIEHRDGFKTLYCNLLTTEFVTEGEKVSKGQSLGTVGNSASFEIADEPHLHFEMIKDEKNVDPTLHLK